MPKYTPMRKAAAKRALSMKRKRKPDLDARKLAAQRMMKRMPPMVMEKEPMMEQPVGE